MIAVAALYIDPRGPYPKMAGVDCWDEERDVDSTTAHSQWSPIRRAGRGAICGTCACRNRERRTADAEAGPIAVEQVRRWAGVLEQPAGSKLWEHCDLPQPSPLQLGDAFGFSIEIQQVSWGHCARKRTWLYIVGVPRNVVAAGMRFGGSPTHWVSGGRLHDRKGCGGVVPPGIKVCSAQQRRRTPPLLAEWLVSLARGARRAVAA